MSKDHNIKFYPPIWEKLKGVPNINYMVNLILGEKLGVTPDVIEAYHRKRKGENQ